MSKAEEPASPGEVTLKSVIIYDEPAFVAKATAILRRVGNRTDVEARWLIRTWPAFALQSSAGRDRAIQEAADAHLIVIPLPRRAVAVYLWEWLGRWAAHREVQEAAVAAIGDASHGFNGAIGHELTALVQKHGVKLILDERPVAKPPPYSVLRFSRAHVLPLLAERARRDTPASRQRFRSFGINE